MGRRHSTAVRSEYGGFIYDSKFEARQAFYLDCRQQAGDIQSWERQYKVDLVAYDHTGRPAMKKTHKIDFRVLENDGTYTLLEAKGNESQGYKEVRKWLEALWLPFHTDHKYEVIHQGKAPTRRPRKLKL